MTSDLKRVLADIIIALEKMTDRDTLRVVATMRKGINKQNIDSDDIPTMELWYGVEIFKNSEPNSIISYKIHGENDSCFLSGIACARRQNHVQFAQAVAVYLVGVLRNAYYGTHLADCIELSMQTLPELLRVPKEGE